MAHSRFGERLGFARWLYHLAKGEAPKHSEIGDAAGRTGAAVSYWMTDEEPPSDFRVHAPLAEFLGVESDWLIHEKGAPPRPELWKAWITERHRAPRMPASAFKPAGKKPAAKKQA